MTIESYLRLLKIYRWKILAFVFFVAALSFIGSFAKLLIAPSYVSSVEITLLPETSEMSFAKEVLGGTTDAQFNAINKTVAEIINSRPVLTRAIEIANSKSGQQSGSNVDDQKAGIPGVTWLLDLARGARDTFGAWYNYLNSGSPAWQGSPEEALLDRYSKAIKVQNVEGSLVLRVSVTLESPEGAANFANALVAAYIQHTTQRASEASQRISGKFDALIAGKQAELDKIIEEEFLLRRKLGSLTLEEQRQSLAKTLEAGRDVLAADVVENEQIKIRLAYAEERRRGEGQRELLQKIDEEIYTNKARQEELGRRIQMRRGLNDELQSKLTQLAENEQPFLTYKARQAALQQEIDTLRRMSVSPAVSSAAAGGRIQVINEARVPVYPDSPKVIRNTQIGFILGILIAGMWLVLLAPFRAMRERAMATETDAHSTTAELKDVSATIPQAAGIKTILMRRS
jgi:uncharacterized protein involved in exopolysaccharide biosynthesis